MFREIENPGRLAQTLYKSYLTLFQMAGIIVFIDRKTDFKISTILIISVCFKIIFYFLFAVTSIYLMMVGVKTILIKITLIIWIIAAALYAECTWICAIVNRQRHIEFLYRIGMVDKRLKEMNKKINYARHINFVKWETMLRIVHIILPTIGQIALVHLRNENLYSRWSYMLLFTSIAGLNTLFSHMVTNFMHLIKQRFCILNEFLTELIGKPDINMVMFNHIEDKYGCSPLILLNNVCYLHHYLIQTVELMNQIFGFNLAVLVTCGFVNIVVGLFFCSRAFHFELKWSTLISNFLVAAFYAIDILYICHSAQYSIEEAKKAGLLIHKIETSDYDMKDEIEMFSLQIANEKVEFNAAGFFPINYTLVFSIIGGVTTYLIILIQLAANKSINAKSQDAT